MSWDGGGGDFSWNNAANWDSPGSPNTLPGAGDEVVISAGFAGITVVHGSGSTTVKKITSEAALSVATSTLAVLENSIINNDLTLLSSTLSTAGTFAVQDHLQWNNATISGAGSLSTYGTTQVSAGGLDTTWDNYGDADWTVGWSIVGGGTLHNHPGATFDIQGDAIFGGLPGLRITTINEGTIRKTAGAAIARTNAFDNAGTVIVQSGTLDLGGGTSSGEFLGDPGTTLVLSGVHNLTTTSLIQAAHVEFRTPYSQVTTVAGTYDVSDSTSVDGIGYTTLSGEIVSLGTSVYTTGVLTLAPSTPGVLHTDELTLESTVYTGLGLGSDLQVHSHLQWNGGSITGSGHLVTLGSTLVRSGGLETTWDNYGDADWTCYWSIGGGGTLHNHPGATFDIQGDAIFGGLPGLGITTHNEGTIRKTAGAAIARTNAFDNAGVVEVLSGTLQFPLGYSQTAGATSLAGGDVSAPTLTFAGGLLTGDGNVIGNVVMAGGELSPETFPKSITVHGNYLQQATSSLHVQVGRSVAGPENDQLVVSGTVSLSGALVVDATDTLGSPPEVGDQFTILRNLAGGAISGTFDGLPEGAVLHSEGYEYAVSYLGPNGTGHDVTLTVLYAPPPPSLSATLDGAGNLTVADVSAADKDNHFTIEVDGGNLIIRDAVERFFAAPAGWTLGPGETSISIPLASFTGSITILGQGGSDTFEILLASSPPGVTGITLSGGTGDDLFGTLANRIKPLVGIPISIDGGGAPSLPYLGNAATGDELWLDVTAMAGHTFVDTVGGRAFSTGISHGQTDFIGLEIFHLRDDGREFPRVEMGDLYLGAAATNDKIVLQRGSSTIPVLAQLRINVTYFSPLFSPTRRVTINGSEGNDHVTVTYPYLVGNNSSPLIQGVDLFGFAGNDYLAGSPQRDRIFGGVGNDTMLGGAGEDRLGIDPDDAADLGAGNDKGDGGAGNDILLEDLGNDSLTGNDGDDLVYGGAANDTVGGAGGSDRLYGGAGNDSLVGNAGADLLVGGTGNDRLLGEVGRDILLGGEGADNLAGGNDDDLLIAGVLKVDLDPGPGEVFDSSLPNDAYDQVLAQVLATWAASGVGARPTLQAGVSVLGVGSTKISTSFIRSLDGPTLGTNIADTLAAGLGADWLIYSTVGTALTRDKSTLDAFDMVDADID